MQVVVFIPIANLERRWKCFINKTLIAIAAIFSIALVGAFALFLQSNRFGLADAGSGAVYKIDRKTGRTWMVVGNREVDVLSSDQQSTASSEPRNDALDLGKAAFRGNYFVKATVVDLVKKSKALGPDFTVETFIGSKVSKLNRPIELKGWTPVEVSPALWLVSYTYDIGEGLSGYFFQADARSGQVRVVAGDLDLENKYNLVCRELMCKTKPMPAEIQKTDTPS